MNDKELITSSELPEDQAEITLTHTEEAFGTKASGMKNSDPSDLGAYFLAQRTVQGITYTQIENSILIPRAKIQAIEENRFRDLGDYGLARSIVYNYARYLELDEKAVLSRLGIMMPETMKKEFVPKRKLKHKTVLLSTNFLWLIGIILFVGVLGFILLQAYKQGYLKAPEFFASTAVDSTKTETDKVLQPIKPDTLRQKLLQISSTLPASDSINLSISDPGNNYTGTDDPTDYIHEIFGESPINITEQTL